MRISDPELHRLQVLKAIRKMEPVARTDLVKATRLAGGTITQLTADLLGRRVLIEEKVAGSGAGRPRMALRINAAAGHALSVIPLPNGRISLEIVDLKGDCVFFRESSVERVDTLEQWAHRVAALIAAAIDESPLSKRQIRRIGIVVHGVVDNVGGIVRWVAYYPDKDVPVASIVEKQLRIPVVVDSEANVIARAEHWFGGYTQLDDFSIIVVDQGLNSAHYVDGMLWRGAHGINPEFGHTKVFIGEGRPCYCGGAGCLVTYSAIFGIVSQICECRGLKPPPQRKLISAFRQFAAEAREGDQQLRDIFGKAASILGTAIANMISERDPGRLLVVAFEPDLLSMMSNGLLCALKANTLPALAGRAEVEFKLIDANQYRKGSAALALEHIYRS